MLADFKISAGGSENLGKNTKSMDVQEASDIVSYHGIATAKAMAGGRTAPLLWTWPKAAPTQ